MTVRLRLTVLYGLLFLVSGAGLLAITYLLVAHGGTSVVMSTQSRSRLGETVTTYVGVGEPAGLTEALRGLAAEQQAAIMHRLLVQSGVALAVMVAVSVVLGWVVAGRVLRPLHAMNGRLEAALDSHRRFVANAAHELRTPLTLEHALLEEAVLDPEATVETYRAQFAELMVASEQQARLLESLLVLATSERGLDRRESVDLAGLAEKVLVRVRGERPGVVVEAELGSAWTTGDPALVERLVANLVDNATAYNVPDGWVRVVTGTEGAFSWLSVSNSGPSVPPEMVEQLLNPFQRLDRTAGDGHHGLGLSIVRAIAAAHAAELVVRARPEGGLVVGVRFSVPVV
ncbi:sensor histidine kinase [Actinoplanes regularis]|uniref:histidine kinase n=1 Tax=Actinoplanes regularis TaxID=52697 RepID=A0A238YCA5_9ACTN|nr:ATP-binding protein [Actinoplanes regularis]GIE86010.1 two-component sensor histidine kinase [Actinoplanes regularis]SNR68660.1 Signal transduction histidine kinase [Actinoplanes regularis]